MREKVIGDSLIIRFGLNFMLVILFITILFIQAVIMFEFIYEMYSLMI
jgi:hypothetical protein